MPPSIGTALLNTLAASAATDYLAGKDPTNKLTQAKATIEELYHRLLVIGGLLRRGHADRVPALPARGAGAGRGCRTGRPHVSGLA
jgi:hypothetical protein